MSTWGILSHPFSVTETLWNFGIDRISKKYARHGSTEWNSANSLFSSLLPHGCCLLCPCYLHLTYPLYCSFWANLKGFWTRQGHGPDTCLSIFSWKQGGTFCPQGHFRFTDLFCQDFGSSLRELKPSLIQALNPDLYQSLRQVRSWWDPGRADVTTGYRCPMQILVFRSWPVPQPTPIQTRWCPDEEEKGRKESKWHCLYFGWLSCPRRGCWSYAATLRARK